MSFKVSSTRVQPQIVQKQCCPNAKSNDGVGRIIGFTPRNSEGTVSCVSTSGLTKTGVSTSSSIVTIPGGAIIDSVDFYGMNKFSTKGVFRIGLGQLNEGILIPLIDETSTAVSNENVGGHRSFNTFEPNGKTTKAMTLYPTYLNVIFEHPVTSGYLQVVVNFHTKTV